MTLRQKIVPSRVERPGIDDTILVLQQDNDWVKKCMEYEEDGARPKRTWREIVQKDCQACKLNKENAMDGRN